jgi:hypothetical protein
LPFLRYRLADFRKFGVWLRQVRSRRPSRVAAAAEVPSRAPTFAGALATGWRGSSRRRPEPARRRARQGQAKMIVTTKHNHIIIYGAPTDCDGFGRCPSNRCWQTEHLGRIIAPRYPHFRIIELPGITPYNRMQLRFAKPRTFQFPRSQAK